MATLDAVHRGLHAAALACALLAFASPAAASDWLPHPADASWVYTWTDTAYNTAPTNEKVTVKEQKGASFSLAWTTQEMGNSDDAVAGAGFVAFQENPSGLFVVDWQATPPPPQFPIMCAQVTQCGNSLSSSLFNLIWGNRTPLIVEPLLLDTSWSGVGGARNDVASTSQVVDQEKVTVPAFPDGVTAVKVRSNVTQAGAIGDPYGSGIRDVWWVYGVGPVKIVFAHSGGTNAPVTTVELRSTTLTPKALPTILNYFPMKKGATAT